MASQTTPAPALDVLGTLQLAFRLWWREFAPITGLGFALVTCPALVARALAPWTAQTGFGTIVATTQGVLGMLFAAAVSFGALASVIGKPLPPRRFVVTGLGASQPGLVTGLTLGAGAMSIAILLILSRSLGGAGAFVALGSLVLALYGAATLLPAVPAAVAERLTPVAALERAARLTRGNRTRLMGLALLLAIGLVVLGGMVTLLLFGPDATPEAMARTGAKMGFDDPGLWIALLSDLLLAGLLACVPPAVYARLALRRR